MQYQPIGKGSPGEPTSLCFQNRSFSLNEASLYLSLFLFLCVQRKLAPSTTSMKIASASLASGRIREISTLLFLLLIAVSMSSKTVLVADAFSAEQPPPPPATTSATKSQHQNTGNCWLVVDFDGTCTVRDTISVLPRLAALAQSRVPQSEKRNKNNFPMDDVLSPDAAIDFQGRLSIFSMLENEYFRRYTEVQNTIQATTTTTTAAAAADDDDDGLEQLAASIDQLDGVSTEITHEVSRWRVLQGLGKVPHTELKELIDLYKERQDDLEPGTGDAPDRHATLGRVLESFSLRKGCLSVLRRSASRNYGIGILSINWCPALIEALLVHPLCCAEDHETVTEGGSSSESVTPPLRFEDVPIWSNSVDGDGIVALPFPGAISKRDQILRLQQQQQQQQQQQREGTSGKVVYVGDSSTDLLAILQADVGILLGGSTSATSLAAKFGFAAKPLCDYHHGDVIAAATIPVVWTANDWNEIGSFLDRIDAAR